MLSPCSNQCTHSPDPVSQADLRMMIMFTELATTTKREKKKATKQLAKLLDFVLMLKKIGLYTISQIPT